MDEKGFVLQLILMQLYVIFDFKIKQNILHSVGIG